LNNTIVLYIKNGYKHGEGEQLRESILEGLHLGERFERLEEKFEKTYNSRNRYRQSRL
jgi:hypothetical protein